MSFVFICPHLVYVVTIAVVLIPIDSTRQPQTTGLRVDSLLIILLTHGGTIFRCVSKCPNLLCWNESIVPCFIRIYNRHISLSTDFFFEFLVTFEQDTNRRDANGLI